MKEKTEGIFGLLTFNDTNEFNNFKNDINDLLKKSNYINDNNKYNFSNNICECNISKKRIPSWNNNIVFKKNVNEYKNEYINHTYYRIIIIKYCENTYYFERNGNIGVCDILIKYTFNLFVKTKWNKLFDKKLSFNELIRNYLIDDIKNDTLQNINKVCNDNKLTIIDLDIININTFENLYNEIPKLQSELKLMPYDYNTCIRTTKNGNEQSETIYNKNVCDADNNYILLDCKYTRTEGIEVADIYDKRNNLFFHIKKEGDHRVTGFQIILGALNVKDKDKCDNYFKELHKKGIDHTQINTENFKFAIGIIQTKKSISYKDKITLGIVYHHLKKLNIEFYIDNIDVVNKPIPNTKKTKQKVK